MNKIPFAGWLSATVLLAVLGACGSSAQSGTTASGGSGGSGGQSSAGGSAGRSAAGATGGGSGAGANGGGGGVCMSQLLATDSACPSDPNAIPTGTVTACSQEGLVCNYQLTTSTPGICVHSTFACCNSKWIGGEACPMPVTGQAPGCPGVLPDNSDPFNPPACTTQGLQCGYYPVDNMLQQNVGCCNGHWKFCFPTATLGPPSCACP